MENHDERRVLGVVDGGHRFEENARVLDEYDATVHVGFRTVVLNAAIERVDADGEETIEVPKPDELRAAAAIVRCLTRIKLRGFELKAMRKIMGLTLSDMAKRMDDRTAAETISRWESEAQPMGGYAEKTFRLIVCEMLSERAPGVSYNAKKLIELRVLDPWRVDENYEAPTVELQFVPMKEQSGTIVKTWNDLPRAA